MGKTVQRETIHLGGEEAALLHWAGKNALITYLILNFNSFPTSAPVGIEIASERLGWEHCQLWMQNLNGQNFARKPRASLREMWITSLHWSLFPWLFSVQFCKALGVWPRDWDAQSCQEVVWFKSRCLREEQVCIQSAVSLHIQVKCQRPQWDWWSSEQRRPNMASEKAHGLPLPILQSN